MGRVMTIRCLLAVAILTTSCHPNAAGAPEAPVEGTVVSVTGKVEAIWTGGATALAKGDGVRAADTIKTAPGAAVEIRLKRNGAIWSMRGNLSKRVDQSLAWSAPPAAKSDVLFGSVADASRVSAGRHQETEAASSGESVQRRAAAAAKRSEKDIPPNSPPSAITASAPPPQNQPAPAPESNGAPAPKREPESERKKADLVPGSGGGATASSQDKEDKPAEVPADAGRVTATGKPEPKKRKVSANAGLVSSESSTSSADQKADSSLDRISAPLWTVVDAGASDASAFRAALLAVGAGGCTAAGTVEMRFEIGADGKVGDVAVTSATGAVASSTLCIEDAIRATTFPVGKPAVVTVRFAR